MILHCWALSQDPRGKGADLTKAIELRSCHGTVAKLSQRSFGQVSKSPKSRSVCMIR